LPEASQDEVFLFSAKIAFSMKTTFFFLLCGMTFCLLLKNKPTPPESAPATPTATATVSDTISFAAQIQPILQTRCNPCHFPGGKMYEKMPFDQAKTILDHPEGILKRINEGEDGRLMKAFIEESKK
jgi:uncharacterized membrane protein